MDFLDYDYVNICGKRKLNEDRVLITNNIIAVLDGHAVHPPEPGELHVVDLVVEHLPKILDQMVSELSPNADIDTIQTCIQDACLSTDQLIFEHYEVIVGGSTFSGVIYVQGHMFMVNIGDSETVVSNGRLPLSIIAMSTKHKPNMIAERKRIQSRGAFVSYGRVNGQLAVSRAFGDYDYGKERMDGSFNPNSPIWALPTVIHVDCSFSNIFIFSDGFGDHCNKRTMMITSFKNDELENTVSVKLLNEVIDKSYDNITIISAYPKIARSPKSQPKSQNGRHSRETEVSSGEDCVRMSGSCGEGHGSRLSD